MLNTCLSSDENITTYQKKKQNKQKMELVGEIKPSKRIPHGIQNILQFKRQPGYILPFSSVHSSPFFHQLEHSAGTGTGAKERVRFSRASAG